MFLSVSQKKERTDEMREMNFLEHQMTNINQIRFKNTERLTICTHGN
jgi:hypothetical protein